ncbi:YceI family protein [Pontibacter qinzhouensis]|uniref:YceI family protein n=1 Tax=Pontibacter qinzhouensis TaxID=2603253 RepID=A0A5C8JLB6_9BACT|nr:YceI family protein [Pontibacter qinzhouensis]TXK37663.1 YceI family protein [Pontibacter qinzhouensis]
MKKNTFLAAFAAVVIFSAFKSGPSETGNLAVAVTTEVAAPAKGKTYQVVLDKSELKWKAAKVVGEHYGTLRLKSGDLTADKSKVTAGTFVIDMASIVCTDNAKVGAHLLNDDFFDVPNHPTATFKITSVKPLANAAAGKPNYSVTGDMTIKGITNPVTFPAIISVKDGVVTTKADVVIDRTKFDIKYRSSNFFEGLGDKAINNDFTVALDVVAQQAAI